MLRLETFKIALSNSDLPTLLVLQAMADGASFLFRLEIEEIRLGERGPCLARIDGQPVTFECEPRTVAQVVGSRHADLSRSWSHAYAFRGTGDLLPSVVSGMAAFAYAHGTGGALFGPEAGPFQDWDGQRKGLDGLAAALLGTEERYVARYPEDRYLAPERIDTIVTRIHRNDEVIESRQSIEEIRRRR